MAVNLLAVAANHDRARVFTAILAPVIAVILVVLRGLRQGVRLRSGIDRVRVGLRRIGVIGIAVIRRISIVRLADDDATADEYPMASIGGRACEQGRQDQGEGEDVFHAVFLHRR